MSREFTRMIVDLRTEFYIEKFISEFFTPTEQIMFAKRLATIMMIHNGYSFSAIERTLKLSPSTVTRLWKMTETDKFTVIGRRKLKEKARKKFWDDFDALVRLGMPEMGRGRWKFLDKRKS